MPDDTAPQKAGSLESIVAYLRTLDAARPERGLGKAVDEVIQWARRHTVNVDALPIVSIRWFDCDAYVRPDDAEVREHGLAVFQCILRMAYPEVYTIRGGCEYEPDEKLATFIEGMFYKLVQPHRLFAQ